MAQVIINGKTYGLRFDLSAMEAVEAEFGGMKEMYAAMKAQKDGMEAVKKIFVILANAHRGFCGEPEDVTEAALRHAPLRALGEIGDAIRAALEESMRVETVDGGEADDDEHDAYLEAIEKNGVTGAQCAPVNTTGGR